MDALLSRALLHQLALDSRTVSRSRSLRTKVPVAAVRKVTWRHGALSVNPFYEVQEPSRRNSSHGCSSSGRSGRCEAVVASGTNNASPSSGGEDNSRREVLQMAEMLQRLSERIDKANEVSRQLKTDILAIDREDASLTPIPLYRPPSTSTSSGVLSFATKVDSIPTINNVNGTTANRPPAFKAPPTQDPLPPFQSATSTPSAPSIGYRPPPASPPNLDLPYPMLQPTVKPTPKEGDEEEQAVGTLNDVNTVRKTLNKKLSDANMLTRKLEREARQMDVVVKEAKEQLQLVLSELDDLQWMAEELGKSAAVGKAPYQLNGKPLHEVLIAKARGLKEAVLVQMRRD